MAIKPVCLGAFAALALAAPAFAHHSFAMFDNEKTVSISGTVKELDWSNPHSWLYIVAPTPTGKSEDWAFEMASPFQLISKGWKADLVKPGDKVTVQVHPMKDGSRGGSYVGITLPDGRVLGPRAAG